MEASSLVPSHAKRPYASRLPEPYSRHAMLCLRVSLMSRAAVQRLASERSMSASDYLSRLVNEHLNGVYRARGPGAFGHG
jgi:hypothetical protein